MNEVITKEYSEKNAWVYFFLMHFLGVLGVHKFYLNKTTSGIIYIFTAGLFTIGLIIDYFSIILGKTIMDNEGKILQGNKSLTLVARLLIIVYVVIIIGLFFFISNQL